MKKTSTLFPACCKPSSFSPLYQRLRVLVLLVLGSFILPLYIQAQCYNSGWGGGVYYGGGFNTCTAGTVSASSTQYQQFDGIAGYTYNFELTGGWASSSVYWTYFEYRSGWTAIYNGNGQTANFTCQQSSPGGSGWNLIVFYYNTGCPPTWPGSSATLTYKVTSYTSPTITAPANVTVYNSPNNSCGAAEVFGNPTGSPSCSGTSWGGGFNVMGGPLSSLSSNLKLWCRADAGIATDVSGNVENWYDMSGNGNRFYQYWQAYRPSYTASSSSFNGNPCLTFNTSQFLTLYNSLDGGANSNYTMFVVDRLTGTNSRLCSSASTNWLFGNWGGGEEKCYCNNWITSSASTPSGDQIPHMYEITSNSNVGSGTNFYDYGVLQATGTGGSPNGPGQLQLNGWSNGLNEMSSGEVAEVIYFNTILTAAQRQIIEGYLAYKYNLPCPLASSKAFQTFTTATAFSFLAGDAGGKNAAATATASLNTYPGPTPTLSTTSVCSTGNLTATVANQMAPAGQCLTTGTGSSNYLLVGTSTSASNVTLGSTWTLSAWVKFPLPANGNWNTLFRGVNYHPVIVERTQGATNAGLILGAYQGGFYPASAASVVNGGTIASNASLVQSVDISSLSSGWHHIAASGSGNTESFYVDGVFVGKSAIQVGYSGNDNIVAVGNYQGGGQDFGTIDEVKVYNVALSQNAISNLMTQPSTSGTDPNWNNLVAYYKMDASPVVNSATGSAACSSCNGTVQGSATAGSSATAYYTYVWSASAGSPSYSPSSSTTSETVTVSNLSSSTLSVYATANGCNSTTKASAAITVSTPSSAVTGISGGGGTICQGSGVTLTATGGSLGTGANYQWGTGSVVGTNPIGGATSISYTPTPSSTTSYWVSVTGPAPCGGAGGVSTTVTVNTPSSAVTGISGGGGTICQGSGVTLTASGGSLGTGANYQWGTGTVVGTNPIGGATSISYTPTPSSTTSYWVSVTGPSPCNGAGGTYTTVNVNTPSTAPTGISGGGGTICQGSGVTLTATGGSLGTGANYQWGTGSVVGTSPIAGATSVSYTPTPSSTTSYWVSVTGPSPCNGAGGVTTTVNVNTPSTAPTGISGGGGTICQGSGVTLTATGGSLGTGANYQWGTGAVVGTNPIAGATSISYTPTPSSTTTYWVSVTGPSPCNGAGGVTTTVNVNTPSTAPTGISGGGGTICQGSGVTLTATGGSLGTGANYQWGTGSVVGTSPIAGATSVSYTPTPSSTTSYWVSVTGPSPCNGAGGVTTTVNVNTPSSAVTGISGGGGTICQGNSVTLTATGGSLGTGANYQWGTGAVVGTNPIGGATSISYTPTPSSTTTYWVSVTGPSPCNGAGGVTTTVNVNTPSTAPTGISGTTTICQGNSTTLTATGGSLGTGANYQWGTGSVVGTNPIGGATSVSYTPTPSSTTSYWVSVTGPSPCNGAGGVTTTVNVNTPSTAPTGISGGGGTICQGNSVTLTATGGSLGTGATYQWGTGGTVGTSPIAGATSVSYTPTPSSTTSYWVSVTGAAPCGSPAGGATTTVNVNTPSTAPTGISGTTTICSGASTTLTATGGSLGTGANYQWGTGTVVGTNPIAGATSVSYSPTPASTTSYWVSVTGPSPCNGAGGVSTTVNVTTGPSSASIADVIDPCNGGHTATVTITGGTSPYNFTVCGTPYTNQSSPFEIPAGANSSCTLTSVTDANSCPAASITGSPVSYPTPVLTSGDVYACTVTTGATKVFYDNSGNLMVKITDGGNTLGNTNVDVTVDSYVHQFGPTTPQSYLQRHFKISPANTSGSASVCLYMSDAEVAALSTASASDNHNAPAYYSTFLPSMTNAVVTKFHGGAETPYSNTSRIVLTPTSKTHNPTVNGVTFNNVWEVCMNVSSWSGFYIHAQNVNNTPLPVTLLYLTADAIDNKYIDLDWATASEINNKGFAVERSTNGTDFTQIGWVDGHGNSNTQLSYSYSDRTVQPGTVYYYRLKQVDFDGQYVYSEIVSASLIGEKGFSFEDMIPNPAVNSVQLGILTTAGQKANVTITDMLGRVVLNQPWQLAEGYNISTFDISGLSQGTYSVSVYAGSSFTTKKLVVTR
ncbi:MAG: T9SS type A sorting domain-containing protein [Bacteroidetes bacterium]|nr:T9SS type A sorting domain-containing protein [Bacteroidota bacterium]